MPQPIPDGIEGEFLTVLTQMQNEPPLHLDIDIPTAFLLVSNLQLALRHPDNDQAGSAIIRRLAKGIQEQIAPVGSPAYNLMEMGWDSSDCLTFADPVAERAGELSPFPPGQQVIVRRATGEIFVSVVVEPRSDDRPGFVCIEDTISDEVAEVFYPVDSVESWNTESFGKDGKYQVSKFK